MVIIIIAILAAIAIPTFLGQRQKAQDAAAKSLVCNAMTAIEAAYVDLQTFDPSAGKMDSTTLHAIEPSIIFTAVTPCVSATGTFGAVSGAKTAANTVAYDGNGTTYSVASFSAASHYFGVYVNKAAASNTFYRLLSATAGQGISGW